MSNLRARKKVLITLVGHQPMPNLLAIRHERPEVAILISTPAITERKDNLKNRLRETNPAIEVQDNIPTVDAWNINSLEKRLNRYLGASGLDDAELVCDVTGGTKAMAIGLARFAAVGQHRLIYVESEAAGARLQHYLPQDDGSLLKGPVDDINVEVTIDDLVALYQPNIMPNRPSSETEGAAFEAAVQEAATRMTDIVHEIRTGLKPSGPEEIDLVVRHRTRFAFIECKAGRNSAGLYGVYQLNNAASERYFGTYTGKVLVVKCEYPEDNHKLARLHNVRVVELPSWQMGSPIDETGVKKLRSALEHALGIVSEV